jgi:hypothetical protein
MAAKPLEKMSPILARVSAYLLILKTTERQENENGTRNKNFH